MNRNFSVLGVYVAPQFEQSDKRLSAVGWDGKSMWSCSDESQNVYRDPIKALKKINF